MPTSKPVTFPETPTDPAALADWLELTALRAADGNASAGDLERELDRLDLSNRESLIGACMLEIDKREKASGFSAYPFRQQSTFVELKNPVRSYPSYVFCLSLSYFGWKARKKKPYNPWLLFEELCSYSAKNFIGGESLVFGTSSRTGKGSKNRFQKAIDDLAKKIGEGEGFRPQRTFSAKDSKLDVVAWKDHPDSRASKLILFGQCAAGANWKDKLSELIPQDFWEQWMRGHKVSELLRGVFIPHRIFDDDEWERRARSARLLFDRCRIVFGAHEEVLLKPLGNSLVQCCKSEWGIG